MKRIQEEKPVPIENKLLARLRKQRHAKSMPLIVSVK